MLTVKPVYGTDGRGRHTTRWGVYDATGALRVLAVKEREARRLAAEITKEAAK